MKQWAILLPFIIAAVWQIASAIIREAEKQRQKQQSAGLSGKQRGGAAGDRGGPPRTSLADRRRAQLEELRSRRQSRGGASQTQVRVGGKPAVTAVQQAAKPSRVIETLETGLESLHESQRAYKRGRDAEKRQKATHERQHAEEDRIGKLQQESREKKKAVSRAAKPVAPDLVSQAADAAYDIRRTSQTAAPLRRRLGNRANLRQLFILKELLDPPVSMRPSET